MSSDSAVRFHSVQPHDGEVMLGCIHCLKGPAHFLNLQPAAEFIRPDGTKDSSHWIILCVPCFDQFMTDKEGDAHKFVGLDFVWNGNEPFIKEVIPN